MDGRAFGAWSKQVAAAGSRRGLLRVLLGGVAGRRGAARWRTEDGGPSSATASPPGPPAARTSGAAPAVAEGRRLRLPQEGQAMHRGRQLLLASAATRASAGSGPRARRTSMRTLRRGLPGLLLAGLVGLAGSGAGGRGLWQPCRAGHGQHQDPHRHFQGQSALRDQPDQAGPGAGRVSAAAAVGMAPASMAICFRVQSIGEGTDRASLNGIAPGGRRDERTV